MRSLSTFLLLTLQLPAAAQFPAPNANGVTFNHMHVVVSDVERHKLLWTRLFDAIVIEKAGYTAMRIDNALVFLRDAEPTAPSAETVIDHFGLVVRDLSGVLEIWTELGHTPAVPDPRGDGSHAAMITLPGGIGLSLREDPGQSTSARMDHVHFVTGHGGRLAEWYADLFGADVRERDDGAAVAAIPGTELAFEAASERLSTEGTAIDHIGFEVEDWESTIAMLESRQVDFEFGPVYIESLDLWVAFVSDPAGALVEISQGLDEF